MKDESGVTHDCILLRQACVSLLAECAGAAGFRVCTICSRSSEVAYGCLCPEKYLLYFWASSSIASHPQRLTETNISSRGCLLLEYIVAALQSDLFEFSSPHHSLVPRQVCINSLFDSSHNHPASSASDGDGRLAMMHRLYRLLKRGMEDTDHVVRFHSGAGISDIDALVTSQFSDLFGKEKVPQIRIL